jgi:hypothetical protein
VASRLFVLATAFRRERRFASASFSVAAKKSPAELVERFAAALPEHPAIVRKPMFGYPQRSPTATWSADCSRILSLFALASRRKKT